MTKPPKNIAILGATGSIGRSSLEVIRSSAGRFIPTYLTTNRNTELLARQVDEFHPKGVVVLDNARAKGFHSSHSKRVEVHTGPEGLLEVVSRDDVDVVINALVGFAGLKPTVQAIKHGKSVALANKETLVVAGEIITALVKEQKTSLIPIDSEHSAILQCMLGEERKNISRIILTASGGPFLNYPLEDFPNITVEQALSHPTWKMGKKITIDSATLMNKGLEVIEAYWLFHLDPGNIEVVIHPQSIIHSMVEFVDGSVKAQLGLPDMKVPIQYALTYPSRQALNGVRVDFPKLQQMTFFKPDREKFRCLQLAYDALELGGTAPALLNAANEIAVEAFLNKKIAFQQIPELIQRAITEQRVQKMPSLDDIMEADRSARDFVRKLI
ncbi:MAG: 1-deoxy-D-xylulose-5-phosphate reductoisomerase [Ignavibacteria bacterium]|nr:1-deoxy-D-xylulose-5-phosphate reductoisomerase [Ignavibacteria bacterium]